MGINRDRGDDLVGGCSTGSIVGAATALEWDDTVIRLLLSLIGDEKAI